MSGRLVVTGGLGFIGSAFVRSVARQGQAVVNIDARTYAADPRRLRDVDGVTTISLDLTAGDLDEVVCDERPDAIFHFAAETHVTRSETDPETFFRTNVEGTRRLLDAALKCAPAAFVHISTDEVYGPARDAPFRESDKEPGEGRATSAYAKSKAIADDLALSYADRLPVIVVRPSNCFGPWQYPEKAIARWSARALSGDTLPVWGDGGYTRDWMYVDDACEGIRTIAEKGTPGEAYNLAPESEPRTNLDIARAIARAAGRDKTAVQITDYDRPQHDRRYWVDASKARTLGWEPTRSIDAALEETVAWYRDNRAWWEPLVAQAEAIYDDARSGTGT